MNCATTLKTLDFGSHDPQTAAYEASHNRRITQLKSDNDMSLVSYYASKPTNTIFSDDENVAVVDFANSAEIASLKNVIVALSLKLKAKEVTEQ